MAHAPDPSPERDDTDDRVPDDAGTDADVDPGLVVPSPDETPASDSSASSEGDGRPSTNRTGLTPDSIQVD